MSALEDAAAWIERRAPHRTAPDLARDLRRRGIPASTREVRRFCADRGIEPGHALRERNRRLRQRWKDGASLDQLSRDADLTLAQLIRAIAEAISEDLRRLPEAKLVRNDDP